MMCKVLDGAMHLLLYRHEGANISQLMANFLCDGHFHYSDSQETDLPFSLTTHSLGKNALGAGMLFYCLMECCEDETMLHR